MAKGQSLQDPFPQYFTQRAHPCVYLFSQRH